jgi:DNA/RNA-binding domain of Phe-tRNA-synthetase-like protein
VEFVIAPEVFDRFPGMRVAVEIADDLDNQVMPPEVVSSWHAAWQSAAHEGALYGNAQSHPRVRPWRERFQAMGVSGRQYPSSIEALLRRAMKGGEPFSINPLVDFYNSVSLRHVVTVGAFDLDQIAGPLELRLTREGDTFTALDEAEPEPVAAGEVAYADGATILTRHFVWRQSRTALITTETRTAFLVSEILGEVGADVAQAVLAELHDGIQTYCGVEGRGFLLDAENPIASW